MSHDASEWQRVSDPVCAHASGLHWDPIEERLYWADPELHRACRLHLPTGRLEHWDFSEPLDGLFRCKSGGMLLALGDRIEHANVWHQASTRLCSVPNGDAGGRFGAGACDPWGRLWIGRIAPHDPHRAAELYCVHPRVRAEASVLPIAQAGHSVDGVAWSPDGRQLYTSDGPQRTVFEAMLGAAATWPPQLGLRMPLVRLAAAAETQSPDAQPTGLAVDSAGHLWMALAEAGCVRQVDRNGRTLAEYALPALCPTALCFGGDGWRTLYVATARAHRAADEIARHPQSGAVFALRVPTPGLPSPLYWD